MKRRFSQPRQTGPLVELRHGQYSLVVAPGFGGRMVSFRLGDRDILRSTPADQLAKPEVYGFAGFPLMPYSGPLFGPGFRYAGNEYELARNVAEEPTCTHGDVWIASFGIADRTEASLDLEMTHEPAPGSYPFRFSGRVRYTLGPEGLAVLLRVTSRDHRPMPAGLGIHPYFPKAQGTRLRFVSAAVWPADAPEAVGLGCQPLAAGLDFTDGPDVSLMVVDRLYEGWDGRAEIIAEDGFRTIIEADGVLDKLQIYSAWHYPYVCVEPVSNANDGFNRMALGVPSHGIRVLDPGRSIEGTVRIRAATA